MARSHSTEQACSFCGKLRREIRTLIAGRNVFICDECIALAGDVIDEGLKEGPEIAALTAMPLIDFLRQYLAGRAVDSVTVGELRRAIASEWERRWPRPLPVAVPTPEPSRPEDTQITAYLSKQYGVPSIDLDAFKIAPEVATLVPEDVQRKHVLVPVSRVGGSLIIAMADPSNVVAIDDVKFLTSYHVEVIVASDAAIRRKIDKHHPRSS